MNASGLTILPSAQDHERTPHASTHTKRTLRYLSQLTNLQKLSRSSFMQSEPSETYTDVLSDNNPLTPTSSHHGRHPHDLASPSLSQSDSEWSLSTSPSPSDYDAWLGPGDALRSLRSPSLDSQTSNLVLAEPDRPYVQRGLRSQQTTSPFLSCPHGWSRFFIVLSRKY